MQLPRSLGRLISSVKPHKRLIIALAVFLLFSTGNASAQTESVEYGFVRDVADPTRLIAVAFPDIGFVGDEFSLNQGSVFSFDLPAGTIDESTPDTLMSDLTFLPANGSAWHVEVFTDVWMDFLGLDSGGRDVYRFTVANTLNGQSADAPYALFSFSLRDGCDGGSVQTLNNGSAFASSLLSTQNIWLGNFFSVTAAVATDSTDIYAGNESTAGTISCEDGGPLSVSLTYFHVQGNENNRVFEWEMTTESSTAGFNLFAEVAGGIRQLNSELIPSRTVDSLTPTRYQFVANSVETLFYLDEVHLDGSSRRHGPFVLNHPYGASAPIHRPVGYLPMIQQ